MTGKRWCWAKSGGAGYVDCEDDHACSCVVCVRFEIKIDQRENSGRKKWKGRARAKRMIDQAYAKEAQP